MTPTEKARRSDALYHDNVSRRELCDRIANLESDNARAREIARDLYRQLRSYDWPLGEVDVWRDRLREIGVGVER